jgi:hypothetical protein
MLDGFEQIGTRGFYRPVGTVSFDRAVDMVAEAMQAARALGLADLLVNTQHLSGFPPPSIFARYELAVKWAKSAGGSLRVALVARPEIIDREKIGVLMAQNRGVRGDVFTSEPSAILWLDTGHPAVP